MPDKTWKAVERRIAKMFGGTRNPLSGRNSRHTSADIIHPSLYIEVKHRSRIPFYKVWKDVYAKAKSEGKIPVLVIHEKGSETYLAVVDAKFLAEVLNKQ